MNALQYEDGYDAVDWAAALPKSSGKVRMVGRSNPRPYAWYAAVAQSPYLTTIVPWLCYTAVKKTLSDLSAVDLVPAFNRLPVIESAERANCPRPAFWDDWFDHQQDDARGTVRDYVNGDFGPQARLDHRAMQVRWFDHWLKGMDNGVDEEAPLDPFIVGENRWRRENEWTPASSSSTSTRTTPPYTRHGTTSCRSPRPYSPSPPRSRGP